MPPPPTYPKRRDPISRIRGIEQRGKFEGKRSTFDSWKRHLLAYLADEPGLRKLIKWAEDRGRGIEWDDVHECHDDELE